MGTSAFKSITRMFSEDRARDAEQALVTVRILGGLLALSIVVIAVLVAGIVGVGVTGTVPGLGEVQIVQPAR